jgi:hypothetical protein
MAASTEIIAARKSTADILDSMRKAFVSKLDDVQKFVYNYTQYGGVVDEGHNPVTITMRSLSDVSATLDNIIFHPPQPPAGLTSEQPQKYKNHVWEAWQINGLEDKLMNIVTTADVGVLKELSGVGIPIALQESMYLYQQDIDRQDLEYSLDVLDGKWAADGYALPPDALVYNRAWEIERYNQKRTDRTRNIYADIAKLAQQNVQWAYENGIKIEQMHADFAINYAKIYKDIIDAIVSVYKAQVEIAIAEMEGHIKKLNAQIEVAKLNIDKESTEMKLKVEQANSRFGTWVKAYGDSIAANTEITKSRIGAANNVASGYQSMFNSQATQFTDINLETTKK